MKNDNKTPLWSGRFKDANDPLMVRFGASIGFDRRLFPQDIRVNRAWSLALKKAGILSESEYNIILEGLDRVRKEMESGSFEWDENLEDIHMAVESRLTEFIGDVGGKIHTGRSRNDQVVTDIHLYIMNEIDSLMKIISDVQAVILRRAKDHIDLIMPGYTHLQQAQPVRFSHYLLGLFWMLKRDRERLSHCREHADCLPLGSGAFAGSAFPIDRDLLAEELGFSKISENSIDAVSDRDVVIELLSSLSILMMHLSRYAEDIIIWSGVEFGFIELPDRYSTGSSMMPQKKNPDSLELIRGKTGRVYGDLIGLLTVMKGLPLTYSKDLQEDKEPLFDAVDSVRDCLVLFGRILDGFVLNEKRIENSMDSFLFATELADYLTHKGMPFRKAHRIVGMLVSTAKERGSKLEDLPLDVYRSQSELFEHDLYSFLNGKHAVELRNLEGGTSFNAVQRQIKKAGALLK